MVTPIGQGFDEPNRLMAIVVEVLGDWSSQTGWRITSADTGLVLEEFEFGTARTGGIRMMYWMNWIWAAVVVSQLCDQFLNQRQLRARELWAIARRH